MESQRVSTGGRSPSCLHAVPACSLPSPARSCRTRHTQLCGSRPAFLTGGKLLRCSALQHARQQPRHLPRPVCQAASEKQTVAVTGATGLVGTRLVAKLTAHGHKVKVLTRNPDRARSKLQYPRLDFYGPNQWASAVCGCSAVVNLAGEPIATRWTASHKEEIKRSRVNVTTKIAEAINACPADQRPAVFVSSSAVGYYGVSETQTFSEASASGQDYLAQVCREWEAAAGKAQAKRVVLIRTGIVLAKEGGALAKMIPVFNIFAGGPLGSGRQWMSWIHRDDLVDLITEAISNPRYEGVYNATAPNPVRMSELCATLGSVVGRPSWLPVPDFALQTLLGEGASVVLEGQKVLPKRAQEAGFNFKYSRVSDALRSLI